jgi:FixJ family two-component response regulator
MPKAEPVIFLLDDDNKFLDVLSALLQARGFATRCFTSVEDFLKLHDLECPGCLVLDVCMPGVNGMELQHLLAGRGVARPIIFLSAHGDISLSVQAMKAGAVTFLTKPVQREALFAAVEEALRKDAVERQRRHEQSELSNKLAALTPREREVLDLVAAGKVNKQIAFELGTSVKTVKAHRGHIMEKLRVSSANALFRLLTHFGETQSLPREARQPTGTDVAAESHPTLGPSTEGAHPHGLRH